MDLKKIPWLLVLWIIVTIMAVFMIVDFACAQFYFPVTSGLSNFYNFGTLRYGTLFGLSGTIAPFITGPNPFLSANAFGAGIGEVFGGFYGITGPFGLYAWPYF